MPRDGQTPDPPRAPWLDLRPRGRRALEAEIAAELEEHVALRVEQLMRQGMSREGAEREARARFGDFTEARRRLVRSARVRERRIRRRTWLHDLGQDIGLALRIARRAPAFHLALVLILALGIGANGAVFGILQSSLLQPLPYRDPANLVLFWRVPVRPPPPAPGEVASPVFRGLLTRSNVMGLRDELGGLEDLAVAVTWQGNLETQFDLSLSDRAERLRGAMVTPNFFELLGTRAALGRVFEPEDARAGGPLLVISDRLWRRSFGSDPGVIGRTVRLTAGRGNARQPTGFVVVGVLPREFRFTYPEETEAWALMTWAQVAARSPTAIAFLTLGRLAPGVGLDALQARALAFRTGLGGPPDPVEFQDRLEVQPVRDWVVGEARPSILLLTGVAALLLLVTCVTVANGLLARVSERKRELALRASLGAGRGRQIRQLLTEGAVLSLGGVAAGTAVALLIQPALRGILPEAFPRVGELGLDPSILGFAAVAASLSTLFSSLAPALGATADTSPHDLLKSSSRGSAGRNTVRWRQGLVAAQAGLATTLLIFASLLLASLWRLGRVPLGFDGDQVLTLEMRLLERRYFEPDALRAFQDQLLERVRATPGVVEAALTTAVPFRGVDFTRGFQRQGQAGEYAANVRTVDPDFFRVLEIPVLRGRGLATTDVDGAPRVMLISETYAAKAFPAEEPLGRTLDDGRGPITVVGVVGDVRYRSLDRAPWPAVYLPRAQQPSELICLVVRSGGGGAASLGPAIRSAIHEVDPTVPAMKLTTIDRIVDESLADRRFYTTGTVAFAILALTLAIVGLSAVVARVIAERRRELAIRAALGAGRPHLVRQASASGMGAVILGVGAGLLAALLASPLLEPFLYGVTSRSPTAFAGVAATVTAVAGCAAWLTSRRQVRLDPVEVLRTE